MVPLTSGALSSTGEFSKLPVVARLDFGRTGLSSRDGEQCSLPVEENMAIFSNLVYLDMTLRDRCFSCVWPRQNLRTAQVQLDSIQLRHQLNKNFGLLTFRIPRRVNFFALFLSLAGLPWIIFVFLCHLSEWRIYCAENEKNIQELITRSLRESDNK